MMAAAADVPARASVPTERAARDRDARPRAVRGRARIRGCSTAGCSATCAAAARGGKPRRAPFSATRLCYDTGVRAVIYPCPACGFVVFDEPPGSFAICSVCGWEDDHVQLQHPALRGGANRESLIESQQASLAAWPLDVKVADGFTRDPRWRPFTPSDAGPADGAAPRTGRDYFSSAVSADPDYYWRR